MKKRIRQKEKGEQRKIALERISILFQTAEDTTLEGSLEEAHRVIEVARNVSMKFNMPFSQDQKRKICKHCHHFLVFGKNARQRLDAKNHRVTITCLDCQGKTWWPYVKEKKGKTD
ncbi:ribonuclease P protein component 4 [Candidatus Altiarchaeota archaeon]